MGSKGSGAYNLDDTKTYTKYFGAKLEKKLTTNLNFKLHGLVGKSDLSEINNSLITDIENVITSTASIKLSKSKNFGNDHFSISLFQPTRVESGKMKLNLVEKYDHLGNLHFNEQDVKIQPSGRQIDTMVDYGVKFDSGFNFNFRG